MKKILIVEDEFMLQMMIEKMIEKMGHQIVAKAKSGDAAIEAVKEYNPDLVLMDVKLIGKYDGIQTIEQVRAFSDVPVLYLTGNTEKDVIQRAEATQPMGFLIKPFEYTSLRDAMEEILPDLKVE
ncbi:MAG: response regulator [Balneolia bacterium]|nr:response regulator [Balneolia bacterium]